VKPRQDINVDAFFLDTTSGSRFVTVTRPASEPKGGWIYIHPFAEEMNKSRRMAALAARELAENGWLVLQIDLCGCGDSAGEFADATWQDWLCDITHAWEWLRKECPGIHGIWTLRAASLLATDWLRNNHEHPPLIFWQPVKNGRQHLVQFLRLKAASEMLSSSSKGVVPKLRAELESGQSVEVAGYMLSPGLADGLGKSRLQLPKNYPGAVTLLEIVGAERHEPSPGITLLAKELEEAAVEVHLATANGPSFWQTLEIETAPALVDATIIAVEGLAR
jgi:exosortase A-associated hydrolase 2